MREMPMKWKIGLVLLLLLCLLTGCTDMRQEPNATQPPVNEPYMLAEGAQELRQDIQTLLIGAVGYDPVTEQSRITSVQILVRDATGATNVLILPKDTRAWINFYEDGQVIYGEYGSLSRVYAAGENSGCGVQNLLDAVSGVLGGVQIDEYVLLNAVQLDMLAQTTDGVYVTVDTAISDYEIGLGYQDISDKLQSYASYSYLSNVGGEELTGTDKDKLARHRELLQAMFEAMRLKLTDVTDREACAREMINCVTTNLSARQWLVWTGSDPATAFAETELLSGRHYEDDSMSLWIYDTGELNDWIIENFYTK